MNKKPLITIAILIIAILISGCIQEVTKKQPNEEQGNEILNIGEAVPEGWNYATTQNFIGEVIPASVKSTSKCQIIMCIDSVFGYIIGLT